MSPPLLGAKEDEGIKNVSLLTSSASTEDGCLKGTELKERKYLQLSDFSTSEDSSIVSIVSGESKNNLNFKSTELRLRLPGSQSPGKEADLFLRSSTQLVEKPLFPLRPSNDDHYWPSPKTAVLSSKRGFSDAMIGLREANFIVRQEANVKPSSNFIELKSGSLLENIKSPPAKVTEVAPIKASHETARVNDETRGNQNDSANSTSTAPANKQVHIGIGSKFWS